MKKKKSNELTMGENNVRVWPYVLGVIGGLIWMLISFIFIFSAFDKSSTRFQRELPADEIALDKEKIERDFQDLINGER